MTRVLSTTIHTRKKKTIPRKKKIFAIIYFIREKFDFVFYQKKKKKNY